MILDKLVQEVMIKIDRRLESEVGSNNIELREKYGLDTLIDPYIKAFPMIRNSAGRIEVMYWITRYAKTNPKVVELALFALNDRSKLVRNYACGALAYANNRESIVSLEQLLGHKNVETQQDAKAAIKAIKEGNHHLFADRDGTGEVFWDPGKI